MPQTTFSNSTQVPKGSIYLGQNTSYSGADIKVLINLPDNQKSNKEQSNDLSSQIKDAEDQVAFWQSAVSQGVSWQASQLNRSTQEWNQSVANLASNRALLQTAQNALESLNKKKSSVQNDASPSTLVLATCQTLSISTFRDKKDVRACGSVYPRGFTRGARQIAGSLVFTVFDESVLWDILEAHPSDFDAGESFTSAIMDQLPPVDILVFFANEYGSLSRMTIYGVEFVSEGQVMSIEDILTESTVSYAARDLDPMRKVGSKVKNDSGSASLASDFQGRKASSLLDEDDYQNFQNDSPYDRFLARRSSFQ